MPVVAQHQSRRSAGRTRHAAMVTALQSNSPSPAAPGGGGATIIDAEVVAAVIAGMVSQGVVVGTGVVDGVVGGVVRGVVGGAVGMEGQVTR
mmetsp:Transcript_112863/g.315305  ORF Transcript_112863/g.315305 Transcript_112863/m.315305 type:complete len:92 (+) Transcript_112863:563-838(+)